MTRRHFALVGTAVALALPAASPAAGGPPGGEDEPPPAPAAKEQGAKRGGAGLQGLGSSVDLLLQ
jgi:hypothetical protein